MNPMIPIGVAYMEFHGMGSKIFLVNNKGFLFNTSSLLAVNIQMEVWPHGFPLSGENIAKKTEFGPLGEPGIALFWKGNII
jgi:hypothetical protein